MSENMYGVYIISKSREDTDDKGKKVITRMVVTVLKTIREDYYITYKEIRKKWLIFPYWAKHINNTERAMTFNTAPRALQHLIDKGYKIK